MASFEGKGLSVPKNPALALRELNRRHTAGPTGGSPVDVNNTTILQTDRQTNQQTDQPTNRLTNTLTNKPTVKPTNLPTNKRTDQPTNSQTNKPTRKTAAWQDSAAPPEEDQRPRVDGRSLRGRQMTADRTMVTSFRLSVETLNRIDELCWKHRMRKGDVVQAALDMYLNEMLDDDNE